MRVVSASENVPRISDPAASCKSSRASPVSNASTKLAGGISRITDAALSPSIVSTEASSWFSRPNRCVKNEKVVGVKFVRLHRVSARCPERVTNKLQLPVAVSGLLLVAVDEPLLVSSGLATVSSEAVHALGADGSNTCCADALVMPNASTAAKIVQTERDVCGFIVVVVVDRASRRRVAGQAGTRQLSLADRNNPSEDQ